MKRIAVGCGKRQYGSDWTHVDQDLSFGHVDYGNPYLTPEKDESIDLIYSPPILFKYF